jgi:hypothetical protein
VITLVAESRRFARQPQRQETVASAKVPKRGRSGLG